MELRDNANVREVCEGCILPANELEGRGRRGAACRLEYERNSLVVSSYEVYRGQDIALCSVRGNDGLYEKRTAACGFQKLSMLVPERLQSRC